MDSVQKVEMVIIATGTVNDKVDVVNKIVYSELQDNGQFKKSVIEKGLKALYSEKEGFDKEYPLSNISDNWFVQVDLEGKETLRIILPKEDKYFGIKGVVILNELGKFIKKVIPMVDIKVRDSKESLSKEAKVIQGLKTDLVMGLKRVDYCDIESSTPKLVSDEIFEELFKVLNAYKFNKYTLGKEIAIISNYCKTCKEYNDKKPYHFMVTTVREKEKIDLEKAVKESNGGIVVKYYKV